jgi:hypothetical protein
MPFEAVCSARRYTHSLAAARIGAWSDTPTNLFPAAFRRRSRAPLPVLHTSREATSSSDSTVSSIAMTRSARRSRERYGRPRRQARDGSMRLTPRRLSPGNSPPPGGAGRAFCAQIPVNSPRKHASGRPLALRFGKARRGWERPPWEALPFASADLRRRPLSGGRSLPRPPCRCGIRGACMRHTEVRIRCAFVRESASRLTVAWYQTRDALRRGDRWRVETAGAVDAAVR